MVKLNLDKHITSSCSRISDITANNLSTSMVDLGVGDPLKIHYNFLDNKKVLIMTLDELGQLIGSVEGTVRYFGCGIQILEDDI